MLDIRVVGDEIHINGLKVAEITPSKALSFSEIENFKLQILEGNLNRRYDNDD